MATKQLSMRLIRVDGGTQSRAEIDQAVVDEYANDMRGGASFPALVVFYDGDSYWLADGFHRFRAAQQANVSKIAAEVRQGTQRDAILHSVGANADHGLRRTNADKRRAVLRLLEDAEWSKWSDYEIAKRCAVSHEFVRKLRSSLATVASENEQRTYTTKYGTPAVMRVGNIGSASAPPIRYANDHDSEIEEAPEGIEKIVFVRDAVPIERIEYNFNEDGDPIIYAAFFYPCDHVRKRVIVRPFATKDEVWKAYPLLNPVQGISFNNHRASMLMYAYFSADAYADLAVDNTPPATPSITDVAPVAKIAVTMADDDEDEEIDWDAEDDDEFDDGDDEAAVTTIVEPPLTDDDTKQLPPAEPPPADPDPFGLDAAVGAAPFTPQMAERSLLNAQNFSNRVGADTPLTRWERERLVEPATPRQNAINAFTSSQSVEWYTPAVYIESARRVFGGVIALDPASCEAAQATVQAERFISLPHDGLVTDWVADTVWLNPPYGRDADADSTVAKWITRLDATYKAGAIKQAILLVNATPDRGWFTRLWAYPICFVEKRIKFYGPDVEKRIKFYGPDAGDGPTHGNCFVYFGREIEAFVTEFKQYGPITFSTPFFEKRHIDVISLLENHETERMAH